AEERGALFRGVSDREDARVIPAPCPALAQSADTRLIRAAAGGSSPTVETERPPDPVRVPAGRGFRPSRQGPPVLAGGPAGSAAGARRANPIARRRRGARRSAGRIRTASATARRGASPGRRCPTA